MLWSKIWLALITLAAGLAVAVALLAPRPLGRDLEHEAGARLERAQHDASLLLKINARKWMDTAAQVATDAVLVESLEQATRGPADLGLVHKTVQDRLRYFNDRMKVPLVIATDAHGRVIARAGLDEGVYKDGVEGFPLVADALRGLRGDDTWSLDGKLYRVAASPVIARDRYVGALVIGQEVSTELAQSMKQVLDVDVAFLLRGRVLASSSPLSILSRLPVLDDQESRTLEREGRSAPIRMEGRDHPYLVVLSPFVGEASGHKAAYALMLARPAPATIGSLLAELYQADPRTLPWRALAPVGGGVLLALLLGLVLMRLEAGRPIKSRLDDDRHPGRLGTIARAVNTTLDRLGSTQARSMPARLDDAILRSPVRGAQPTSFQDESLDSETILPPPRPAPHSLAPPLRSEPPRRSLHDEPPAREVNEEPPARGLGDEPPSSSSSSFAPSSSAEADPITKAPLPLEPMGDTEQVTNPASAALGGGPDLIDAPGFGGLPPMPAAAGTVHASLDEPGFGDDEPTRAAAQVMKQMALQSALSEQHTTVQKEPHAPAAPALSDEEQALETELAQVYHDFIETKQRLGEPTESVTYDKFLGKLKANRLQLLTRYSCKSVRFQVYVKDGKAALKATPVQT